MPCTEVKQTKAGKGKGYQGYKILAQRTDPLLTKHLESNTVWVILQGSGWESISRDQLQTIQRGTREKWL